MKNEKVYRANEICEELKITDFTLANWYNWENKQLKQGLITERYLPQPLIVEHEKGRPRIWTQEMLEQLKEHKSKIITGRNGIYGMYSNPNHFSTRKYKKSIEGLDKE